MGVGAQLHAFYRQVAQSGTLWVIRNANGSWASWNREDGLVVLPVWSSDSRVKRILKGAPNFMGAEALGIEYDLFRRDWSERLARTTAGLGINWEGERISGPEMPAESVFEAVDFLRAKHN
jgi:hypothetical protein